ncbi:MAG: lytic transglycosylase domain-containing protein [Bacteroidetes bacterium]|nr:lytic transglycosylase domain-containing protein [Bacteroidota bacterium]MBM3424840.1 lytic transglycosylase domain-containing protein [Bacteroidota bacterium]
MFSLPPLRNHQATLILSTLLTLCFCSPPPKKITKRENKSPTNGFPTIPKSITFFGKVCSLADQDVQERLDRELLVNAFYQSSTTLIIKKSARYFPIIEPILRSEGIPEDFKYLCVIESNLNNVTSPAGATGLWQFMPATALEYGLKINSEIDERHHLEKSTKAACALIKSNYALFNNWVNACAAYNRGPNGLLQDFKSQGVQHYFDAEMNLETARYVLRIMALKMILENPEPYGFRIPAKSRYPRYKTKKFLINRPITNISKWSIEHGVNQKILRLLNPWILGNQLTEKSLPCFIDLPKDAQQLNNKHSL